MDLDGSRMVSLPSLTGSHHLAKKLSPARPPGGSRWSCTTCSHFWLHAATVAANLTPPMSDETRHIALDIGCLVFLVRVTCNQNQPCCIRNWRSQVFATCLVAFGIERAKFWDNFYPQMALPLLFLSTCPLYKLAEIKFNFIECLCF